LSIAIKPGPKLGSRRSLSWSAADMNLIAFSIELASLK